MEAVWPYLFTVFTNPLTLYENSNFLFHVYNWGISNKLLNTCGLNPYFPVTAVSLLHIYGDTCGWTINSTFTNTMYHPHYFSF